MENKIYIRTDRNGTKYYEGDVPCPRCGGHGFYAIGVLNNAPVLSPHNHGVCYQCLGSGKIRGTIKEYTPEYKEKLIEKRLKKQ